MQTTTPTDKNGSTHRIRRTYYHLGIDSHDSAHVYRTTDETIFAIAPDGTIEYRFDLTAIDNTADDYVAFVREQRGWADQQFGIGALFEQLPVPEAN